MRSVVRHVTIDSSDPYRLAVFWSAVLGAPLGDDDQPGDPEALIALPHFGVLFVKGADAKVGKNRMHFDIAPEGGTRDQEVVRLSGLGAAVHEDHRREDGIGWVTMQDPEGNEFCVERSDHERHTRA